MKIFASENIEKKTKKNQNTLDNLHSTKICLPSGTRKRKIVKIEKRKTHLNDISFSFWSVAQTIFPVA